MIMYIIYKLKNGHQLDVDEKKVTFVLEFCSYYLLFINGQLLSPFSSSILILHIVH